MRSTSSFQSAGVCPAVVMSVIAWQAVQAVSTMSLPLPAGSGLGFWACAATAVQRINPKRVVFTMYTPVSVRILSP